MEDIKNPELSFEMTLEDGYLSGEHNEEKTLFIVKTKGSFPSPRELQINENCTETITVESGSIRLILVENGVRTEVELQEGESYAIQPGVAYRSIAENDTVLRDEIDPPWDSKKSIISE